jgi:hypothetical protein
MLCGGSLKRKKQNIKDPVKNIEIQVPVRKKPFNHFFMHIFDYGLNSKIRSNSLNHEG